MNKKRVNKSRYRKRLLDPHQQVIMTWYRAGIPLRTMQTLLANNCSPAIVVRSPTTIKNFIDSCKARISTSEETLI